jgi:hypothetical protein
MNATIESVLIDPSARTSASIMASLASELSVGVAWFGEEE